MKQKSISKESKYNYDQYHKNPQYYRDKMKIHRQKLKDTKDQRMNDIIEEWMLTSDNKEQEKEK